MRHYMANRYQFTGTQIDRLAIDILRQCRRNESVYDVIDIDPIDLLAATGQLRSVSSK